MTNKVLTIDFETKDPYIGLGYGAGWPYAYNIRDHLFKVLCVAVLLPDGTDFVLTDMNQLRSYILSHDTILAHNATYELGILHYLYKDDKEVIDNLKKKTIYDTKLLFKLYNNVLVSYSLDNLAKHFLRDKKSLSDLADSVWKNDIYPWLKKDLNGKLKAEKKNEVYIRERPPEAKLIKFAYENMDLLMKVDFPVVAKYASTDVLLTKQLFEFVMTNLTKNYKAKALTKLLDDYSVLSHICVEYRLRGVRIDLDKAREVSFKLIPLIANKCNQISAIIGEEVNINSNQELPKAFDKLKIAYPRTAMGNPSITSPWLEKQSHPLCQLIVEARRYKKIKSDFIQKILTMQEYTCPNATNIGKVYPELNILEARTGRFSCNSPNLQQIPSKDEELAPLCRSLFLPEENKTLYTLDFSNQEGRLQIHYAYLLKCEGAGELKFEFQQNPNLDMHQKVADMAEITRSEAKTINLGISYGMGLAKLGTALGLSTLQASLLKEKYDNMSPFLTQLNKQCKNVMSKRGFIITLSGRHSYADAPMYINGERKTFEYKALNKLIQGSACDQIIEAMIRAYKENISILFPVHDELVMSGTAEQAARLKNIMETCVLLEVPSVVEVASGNNWGECSYE